MPRTFAIVSRNPKTSTEVLIGYATGAIQANETAEALQHEMHRRGSNRIITWRPVDTSDHPGMG